MNAGGAETFLMKIYRQLDRTKYQMDFCINVPNKCFYEDEIISLGGKIYRIPSKSESFQLYKKKLFEVVNSVDKIISNSTDELITKEDIDDQLDQVLNLNIFNLTDAIASKDLKKL